MQSTTVVRITDVPRDRDAGTLRLIGALPPERPGVEIPTKALHAPVPAGSPVVVHLDPGQLRVPGGNGTIYSYGPSRVDSYVGDFSLFGLGTSVPNLSLEFWNQPEQADGVVSIRIVVELEHAVRISSTGNPIPMVLSGTATNGQVVTINVPVKVSNGWCVVHLDPVAPGQGFVWFFADLRLL